jgi:hypothetical protein
MKKSLLFVMVSFFIAFAVNAQEVVTIVNPSFELPDGGEKIKDPNLMDGWHSDDNTTTDTGREANAFAPDGAMIGFSRSTDASVYQVVDKLTAAQTEYTFKIKSMITWAPASITENYCVTRFSVMAEGADYSTRIVVDTMAFVIGTLEFEEFTHTYVFPAGHSHSGKSLLIEYKYIAVGPDAAWAGFDDLKLTKSFTTGVASLNQSKLLNVFPNPASGNCTITMNSNKEAQYAVYSLTGKAVKNGTFTKSYNLNLSGLTKGIYFVKVNGENKTEVAKLVVR